MAFSLIYSVFASWKTRPFLDISNLCGSTVMLLPSDLRPPTHKDLNNFQGNGSCYSTLLLQNQNISFIADVLGHVIHLNSSVSEILLMFLYPCVQVFVTPMTIPTKERKRKWPSAGNIKSNIAYNWCTSAKLRSGTILVTLFWLIFSPSHWGFVSPVLLRNICSRPKSNEAGEEAMLKKSRKMRIYRLLVCRNALETNSSREALLRWILSCPNPNRKRPLRWKIP